MWKEWEWDGPEPKNLRMARYYSVFKLGYRISITFDAMNPSDLVMQI